MVFSILQIGHLTINSFMRICTMWLCIIDFLDLHGCLSVWSLHDYVSVLSRCATRVESFPSATYSSNCEAEPELQKMRVLVGAPLRRPPKHQIVADTLIPMFPSIDSDAANLNHEKTSGLFRDEKFIRPEGLSDFFVFCTSDFTTVSKEVHVRTRRVQLLGLEVPIKYIKICSVLIIYVVTEMTCGL